MDYFASFDVSASGLAAEKLRVDVIALNLANVHTTRGPDGQPFRPQRVVLAPGQSVSFSAHLAGAGLAGAMVNVVDVRPMDVEPRLVHEPGHPDADARGFVAYPGINPVSEMITLIEATRAYEANVRALNAGKELALRALEIGGRS